MTLRQYLTIMGIASLVCWAALVFVMIHINPYEASIASFFFFYASMFLALFGTSAIVSYLLHVKFGNEEIPIFRFVSRSFRDAILLSSVVVTLLFLRQLHVLNIWTGTIFLLLLIFALSFRVSAKA